MPDFLESFTVQETVINNKIDHLNFEFEKVMMHHKERILAIETKVLYENGTDDDLMSLYLAEAEETKKQSGGILSAIINAIKELFKKIKNIFTGTDDIDEKGLPEEVHCNSDPEKVVEQQGNLNKAIQNFLGVSKSQATVIKYAAFGGLVAGAMAIKKKFVVPILNKIKKTNAESEKVVEKVEAEIAKPNADPEKVSILQKGLNGLRTAISTTSSFVKEVASEARAKAEEKISTATGYVKGAVSQVKDAVSDVKNDIKQRRKADTSETLSTIQNKISTATSDKDNAEKEFEELKAKKKDIDKRIHELSRGQNGLKSDEKKLYDTYTHLMTKHRAGKLSTKEKQQMMELKKDFDNSELRKLADEESKIRFDMTMLKMKKKTSKKEIKAAKKDEKIANKKYIDAKFDAEFNESTIMESIEEFNSYVDELLSI